MKTSLCTKVIYLHIPYLLQRTDTPLICYQSCEGSNLCHTTGDFLIADVIYGE
jgi:hypothetical protein